MFKISFTKDRVNSPFCIVVLIEYMMQDELVRFKYNMLV